MLWRYVFRAELEMLRNSQANQSSHNHNCLAHAGSSAGAGDHLEAGNGSVPQANGSASPAELQSALHNKDSQLARQHQQLQSQQDEVLELKK